MKKTLFILLVLAACNRAVEVPLPPAIISEAGGLSLAQDAPQWKYTELKVAEHGPPLTPLP
ncbi:MAG: hypothetical protein JNK82_31940, partial [Myxococcaceae bacterium]|nr:hypothetical protein [Myxococcaceae bacterium]